MLNTMAGVLNQSGKPVYVWNKYSVTYSKGESPTAEYKTCAATTVLYYSTQYTFSSETGKYTLRNASRKLAQEIASIARNGLCFIGFESNSGTTGSKVFLVNNGNTNGSIARFYVHTTFISIPSKGSLVGTVESEDETAYPDDGRQDGYWYVKVLNQSGKPVYAWERYSILTNDSYGKSATTEMNVTATVMASTDYTSHASSRTYELHNYMQTPAGSFVPGLYLVSFTSSSAHSGSTLYRVDNVTQNGMYIVIVYTPRNFKESKGSYIDTVESEDPSAYPENGIQNGYWYVLVT